MILLFLSDTFWYWYLRDTDVIGWNPIIVHGGILDVCVIDWPMTIHWYHQWWLVLTVLIIGMVTMMTLSHIAFTSISDDSVSCYVTSPNVTIVYYSTDDDDDPLTPLPPPLMIRRCRYSWYCWWWYDDVCCVLPMLLTTPFDELVFGSDPFIVVVWCCDHYIFDIIWRIDVMFFWWWYCYLIDHLTICFVASDILLVTVLVLMMILLLLTVTFIVCPGVMVTIFPDI